MRSLLSPAPAAAPGAPPATASPPIAANESPALPPPGPEEPNLQAQLYAATEKLALRLIQTAEKELLKEPKEGEAPASIRELRDTVEFAMTILVKLPKLKPENPEDDAGVTVLRAAMQDPAGIVERLQANPAFRQALRDKGWLPTPEKVPHRPTNVQRAERQTYLDRQAETPEENDEDDGVLRRMLEEGKS